MGSLSFWRTTSVVAACVVLAACRETTAPIQERPALDDVFAELQVAESSGSAGLALSGGPAVPITMPSAAQCFYNSKSQFFSCPSTTRNGLTFTLAYQLLDASGTIQTAFNPTTTAAIRTVSDLSGTFTPPPGSVASTITMSGGSDQTLSGLLTRTHTLNGTGIWRSTMVVGSTSGNMTTSSTITGLVLPQRDSPNQYPQAGSIAMDLTGNFATTTVVSRIVMTFNGTSTMTMVMTINGITTNCTLDMANPSATPSCQ